MSPVDCLSWKVFSREEKMRGDMKEIFGSLAIMLLLLLFGIKISWAEDVELEKIVVTPSRIEETYGESGRKLDIISSQDLKNLAPKDISEVLEGISSVNIQDYGSLGASKTIQMRGSTASQVLVMIDSRPINNPHFGNAELNTIPLENIERIEVVHGPASSLYGSSAMGGVVNIITKKPPKEKQRTEFTTSFATFRTYLEQLAYGTRLGRLGYLLTTSYQSSEGHRDHSEYDAKNVSTKLEYEIRPDNKLVLNSGFHKSKFESPGSSSGGTYDDYQEWLKNFLDLNWNFKIREELDVLIKVYQNHDRLEFINCPDPLDKDTHTTKSRGLDLQFNHKLSEIFRLLYGFNDVVNLNNSSTSGKHKYIVRSGYFQNQLDLIENLRLDFGLRLDDYSNFGTEVSPQFSLLYKFDKHTKLHSQIARSFRAPTFSDLYWPLSVYNWGEIYETRGNPNLKPEKGISGELGIQSRLSKYLEVDITYFRSDYDNLIKWVSEYSNGVWVTQPRNINSAIINGVEIENKICLSDNLNINLDYTYLRAKDDKTHKYLTYQPKHKFDLSLEFQDFNGSNFSFRCQFVDRRFHNAANTIYIKRYFILGAKASKKLNKNTTFFVSIDNLLDEKYQTIRGYPMPGFSLTSGIKLEF